VNELSGSDVLLTGVPRGGTTLTCELLNLVPDTVALDEPMQPARLEPDPERVCEAVRSFCEQTRLSLLERREAVTKHVSGRVAGTKLSAVRGRDRRERLATRGVATFEKPLSRNFVLVVKHPAMFTAYLEPLAASFPVFAVVRHPLPVLASWQTVPFGHRDGHMPVAERLDPALHERLDAVPDAAARQLVLLDWLYARYEHLPQERIIRYENIIDSGGGALAVVTPHARRLHRPLESRNRSYDAAAMRELAERLLGSNGAYWRFYDRSSPTKLLKP
jgi:hypothetical protein